MGKRKPLWCVLLALFLCLSAPVRDFAAAAEGGTESDFLEGTNESGLETETLSEAEDTENSAEEVLQGQDLSAGQSADLSAAESASGAVVERIPASAGMADPNTMDSYIGEMLDDKNGNRYAGRIWSDKTVFAYGSNEEEGGLADNTLLLDEETDGYAGSLSFDSDFLNVYSAMGSSQLLYDELGSPFDLVIVLDMSGSMAQSTHYPIEAEKEDGYEETMQVRIENSRIQKTLDAVNEIIDSFMDQNKQNRIAVCVYGANAAVLMPLAHYQKVEDEPYLTVGGMETLYERSDYSTIEELMQENPGMTFEDGIWNINRDACYTVVANAYYDEGNEAPDTYEKIWNRTISNNVKNSVLHPDPDLDGDGAQLLADQYVGYMTNTQGGIYLGMQQLAQTKERTYTGKLENGDEEVLARIPAAIILTDGGANFAFNDPSKDGAHELPGNVGNEWFDVYLPEGDITDLYNDGVETSRLTSIPAYEDHGIFYDSDADVGGTPSTILEVLMTASYMKTVVQRHYEQGWERYHATQESRMPLKMYTVSTDAVHLPAWGRYRIYPTMNPEVYFNATKWDDDNYACIGNDFRAALPWRNSKDNQMADLLPYAYGKWEEWKKLSSQEETISLLADWIGNAGSSGSESVQLTSIANQVVTACTTLRIGRLPNGYFYTRENENGRTVERIRVTNQDVIDNIFYPDEFYDVESEDLRNVFQDIIDELRGEIAVPVEGQNDAGVRDSITYEDPLGEYLEIKRDSITVEDAEEEGSTKRVDMAAVLFGEMHGLSREAVYDASFNEAYLEALKQEETGDSQSPPQEFPEGWYRGSDAAGASYLPAEKAPKDPWESGWVYRISKEKLTELIPTIETAEELSMEGASTVYTLYGFTDSEEEKNRLRINPVYGSIVPSNLRSEWEALEEKPVGNDLYREEKGIYRLSDIRVWTEQTLGSDGIEEDAPGTPPTNCVYVNLPAAALPTQTYWISLGWDGPASFDSNLEDKSQSTPFRLFYGAGLQEGLVRQIDPGSNDPESMLDTSSMSREYVRSHGAETFGSVYFLSNTWSGSLAEGLFDAAAASCQAGDAKVTFSPSGENPYYRYQDALPLYAHAYRQSGDNLVRVDGLEGSSSPSNSDTRWENGKIGGAFWEGGSFMGTYEDEAAFAAALSAADEDENGVLSIKDSLGDEYPFAEGGIVLLMRDLKTPDGEEGGSLYKANDYYFFVEEYYVPEGDGSNGGRTVRQVHCMTDRELGGNASASESVCWSDLMGHTDVTAAYLPQDAGDTTFGVPTSEKMTGTRETLSAYLRSVGIPTGQIGAQLSYWQEMQDVFMQRLDEDGDGLISAAEYANAGFLWVLSIRPGNLRSRNVYASLRPKEDNRTGTAENCFVSAISDYEGLGGSLVIGAFLGNNGKLIIDNPLLYVTNRIDAYQESASGLTFRYQIFIDGVSGEQEAVALKFNPYLHEGAGGWQQQIASLELKTNEAGLVLAAGGQTAIVDRNGRLSEAGTSLEENESYCVYVPANSEDGTKRWMFLQDGNSEEYGPLSSMGMIVYVPGELPDNLVETGEFWTIYRPADEEHPSGTVEFFCKEVWLIPVSYAQGISGSGSLNGNREGEDLSETETADSMFEQTAMWSFSADDQEEYVHLGYEGGIFDEETNPFAPVRMQPWSVDSSSSVSSDFLVSRELLTKPLYFGSRRTQEGKEDFSMSALLAEDLLDDTPFWVNESTCAAVPGQQGAVMETAEYARAEGSGQRVTWLSWDEIARNTAEFTLGANEGLLLAARAGLGYRVTEEGEEGIGFLLKDATQESDARMVQYTVNDTDLPSGSSIIGAWKSISEEDLAAHRDCGRFPDGSDEYEGDTPVRHWSISDALQTDYASSGQTELLPATRFTLQENGVRMYSVYGSMDKTLEAVRYVNEYVPGTLSIANWLESSGGNVSLNEEDTQKEFTYTLTLREEDSETPVDTDLSYVITGFQENEAVEMQRGTLRSTGSEDAGESDIPARKKGVWEFQLKGSQQMSVFNLPTDSSYTVKQAAETDFLGSGAPTGTTQDDQSVTVSGTVSMGDTDSEIVTFTNRKLEHTFETAKGGVNYWLWTALAAALVLNFAVQAFVHVRRKKLRS